MLKKILPAFLLCFWVSQSFSQLIIENNLTVEQYVQDVLLGQNVTVMNIEYNSGSPNVVVPAVGGFESVDSNIGIESGFIMTCGDAAGTVGPNNQTGYTGIGPGGFSGSDSDLLDLVQANGGNSIHDWVIIEFDFIPLGDTIRFNYIWGSEEYDTYVGSGFNDVFGFFISGPGINGPYSNNAENIALVPGTSTGVAINTINNGQGNAGPCNNCDYYNQLGSDGDFFNNMNDDIYTNPYYMQYDGYTDVLTAFAIVQCGQTYHIKLAVCDANDSILDSGVFLQRDSFSSNLVVQVELNLSVSGPNGDTLFENCGEGAITFERPESGNPDVELVAYLGYSGTAINGVDYTLLPDSVVFPPGVMSISFPLDAFDDGILEGTETVHMEIENMADCGEQMVSSEFDFFISDVADPLVVDGYNVEICSGETVTLEPIISGGYAVYGYDWSTNETTSTIDVTPGGTTTYFLTVSDTCGLPSDDATFIVEVLQTPELLVSIDQGDEIEVECNGFGQNITATANGGLNPYTWSWVDDQGFNLWGWENTLWVSSWNAGMVYVEVEDACGFTATDSILITLNVPPIVVDVPETINAPCGQPFTIEAVASGGVNPYWYSWQWNGVYDWNQWTETYTGTADAPGTVTVIVNDQCGQNATEDIAITIDSPPIDLVLVDAVEGNCQTPFLFDPTVSAGSGGFEYLWSENGNQLGTQATLNFMTENSTVVSLLVTDACGASVEDEVIVTIVNPEILVTLGEDINASCIDNTLLTPEVTGGSGGVQYQWFVGGQLQTETTSTFTIQSNNTVDVSVMVDDFCGETASDEVTIIIPDIPLTITAWPDTVICPLQAVDLAAFADGGEGGFTYLWTDIQQAGSTVSVNPITTSMYTVVAEDICGESISTEVTVAVRPASSEFLVTELSENLYEFEATPGVSCGETPCTYVWDFGDGDFSAFQTVEHEFDGLGSYTITLHVTNDIGCTSYSTYTIVGPPLIYIPNSFTPNGDGVNDVFAVVASSLLEYEISIFNRWGEVVFTSTNPKDVWVGDTGNNDEFYAKDGVYSYIVRVKGYDSDSYKEKGTITLIR
ncbi:MAG: choice-of-anchor L domain-containing protein [Flavobacteriales bacterium]